MYINHTKTQDLFSTYQIEYCCANAERYSFCDLLDIDKSRQITLRFLNFYRTFYRSFSHQKIQYQRLSLDKFKRVCEDFLFKAETSSISKLLSCLWSSEKYFESLILLPFCKLRPLSNRKKKQKKGEVKNPLLDSYRTLISFISTKNGFCLFVGLVFFAFLVFFLPSLFVEYNGLFYRWSNVNEIIKLVITFIFAVYMYQRITWVQQILNNVIVVFKKYMIVYF